MPWSEAIAANCVAIVCSEVIVGGTPPAAEAAPALRSSADRDLEPGTPRPAAIAARKSVSLLSLESQSLSLRTCWEKNKNCLKTHRHRSKVQPTSVLGTTRCDEAPPPPPLPGRTVLPDSGTSSPASFTVSSLPSTQK